jgi:hypothetical protein
MTATDPKQWFDAVPKSQKSILRALRSMIISTAPGIVEEIKWNRPWYSTSDGMFCYLHWTKKHVTLGFRQGASLTDPKRLLEGTGKDMRHVKIDAADDRFDQAALLQLIKQALKRVTGKADRNVAADDGPRRASAPVTQRRSRRR